MVKDIESYDEWKSLINGSDVVVVENWATWSGPCREISPDFAQVEEKHPHLKFVKVDVDSQQDVAQEADLNRFLHNCR
ncbi:uncharacterized protein L203_100427 [Cryptococcus depauperatus CBS 7841]|uniref:Thioredoxin domain-containing protein n=1 Tax=Cryptococcus depauperatus CBS 7841 TaxID=1295531 RepID=A0AAJ8JMZ7_9TREE